MKKILQILKSKFLLRKFPLAQGSQRNFFSVNPCIQRKFLQEQLKLDDLQNELDAEYIRLKNMEDELKFKEATLNSFESELKAKYLKLNNFVNSIIL